MLELLEAASEASAFLGWDRHGEPITQDPELADLRASVDRYRSHPHHRTPAELAADLQQLGHVRDLIELEFARLAAAFDKTDEADWHGAPAASEYIRHECRMSTSAALSAVAAGYEAQNLPQSVAALEEGLIGYGHLALMANTISALKEAGAGSADEDMLLPQALEHSVSRFRYDCAHIRHAADAQVFLDQEIDAVLYRRLELFACGNGKVGIRGMLDAAGAATLRTALEPLARRSGGDDKRLRQKRLADALVEVANHVLDADALPQRGNQRPHVQVTTTLETLRGLAGAAAGEMEFAPPIAAETVRRLSCDSSIVRVLLGADSAIVDVGRAKRVVSPALRRALVARDKGCVWPGCDRTPTWTQAHHIVFWGDNGPTDLSNLALLCYRHHWKVHEGGWQLVRSADGTISTVAPAPSYRWMWGRNPLRT